MKVAHHAHILMLEVVAMIEKQSRVILKRLDDINFFSWHDQYGIFPAAIDETVLY
jgi:hypothetical protein